MKKFWYLVWSSAEEMREGWIKLTVDEANAVNYVSTTPWETASDEGYSGTFGIDLNSKTDSEEPPEKLNLLNSED